MELIQGKQTTGLAGFELNQRLSGYRQVWLDLGTGDGRYVEYLAQNCPTSFMIGLDACRENLEWSARHTPANALYLIANAESLPAELNGVAYRVSLNFPWGSLLTGLLEPNSGVYEGLRRVMRPGARLEIRLNGQAARVAGYTPEQAAHRAWQALLLNGFEASRPQPLTAANLRTYPTTWAKRLAYGRDPQAFYLTATRRK